MSDHASKGPFDGLTPEDVRALCATKDNLIVERDRLRVAKDELLQFVRGLREEFCGWTCPSVWQTVDGQPHDQRCKDLRSMLASYPEDATAGQPPSKPNSRQLAELIWKETVRPCYEGMGLEDNDPEPEDREFALQGIEGLLERHAGLPPDTELEKARKANEGLSPF